MSKFRKKLQQWTAVSLGDKNYDRVPYILMKFANPVPGCVISGPVRYHISPDLGLNNGL